MQAYIRLYYINAALIGTWFTSGVVLFFSRKFLSDSAIGWLDALAFAIGLLAEIPSGTIADMIGRRRTVMLGVVVSGVGFAIWGFAVSGWMVFVGIVLFALGTALQSGADEAMMYDYLKANGKAHLWPRISATTGIIARLSYVLALGVGGFVYLYADRLPFLLRALTFFAMLIPLARLAIVDRFQGEAHADPTERRWLTDFTNGIRELFGPQTRWLLPLFLLVQGIAYTLFTAGILRPLLYEKSGLAIAYHSFAIAFALLATVGMMFVIRHFEAAVVSKRVIYGLTITCAVGFGLNIGDFPTVIAVLGLTMTQVATYSLMPILSAALNSSISSRYRATTISAASFLQSVGYVVAAPVVGSLSEQGMINTVAIGATGIVVMGIIVSAATKQGDRTHGSV